MSSTISSVLSSCTNCGCIRSITIIRDGIILCRDMMLTNSPQLTRGIMLGLLLTEEVLEVLAEGGNVGEEYFEAVMLPSFVKGALHLHLPVPFRWT